MRTIAQYPHDCIHYFENKHLARIPEINEELPSVNTHNPHAIDIITMLVWLDEKYELDNNNQIVFELWEGGGPWYLKDFHTNVTFCDPVKAAAAYQLDQALVSIPFSDKARWQETYNLLEAVLYGTDGEILFAPPRFEVDWRRPRYRIPEMLAGTTRIIRVKRVPVAPGANIAYTVRPDGTRVQVP